jgi:hypothetical protein
MRATTGTHKDLRIIFIPIVEFLSDSDSLTHPLGVSTTPWPKKAGSRRLTDSTSRSVGDSPTQQVGESIFDYKYLRDFDAKIGTDRKVV